MSSILIKTLINKISIYVCKIYCCDVCKHKMAKLN